ncbi:PQQ-dependent sugar dehydrogenase [Nitrosococcus watsonii]|uniref:Oxidoreductase, putative n=1 Tax=Nitrosococcus watsoni (strain C-113) TaxID=105559 RepID=D8KC86_NITWC|nr:sorbosone dehydrogenase family protein [Nitrosococcus watsonii]ADJ29757.1 oxidoreductase, putative [Nitrosococcus watsonii C-113]
MDKHPRKKIFYRLLSCLLFAGIVLWFFLPERFAINIPIRLFEASSPSTTILQERLQLPDGFIIRLYASDLPDIRMMRFTQEGDLLVSLAKAGDIVLLERDANGDGQPEDRHTLLTQLNQPHGIGLHQGWLYVAETDAVGRIRFDATARVVRGKYQHIARLPSGSGHWTRTLGFSPDGWLYVSVGSSCNACEEADIQRATLLRFSPTGSKGEIFASGLRNTVGFDWHPSTHQLYGTDNGRDFLGDDLPPDELNLIEQGGFYGWPYAYGDKIPDPSLGPGHQEAIQNSIAPVYHFAAHTAPLGITFLRGKQLPPAYQEAALVALHGSWNRTEKQGYEIVSLHFNKAGEISDRKFATGFEIDGNVIGRPVDVAEGPDGAIYITDDFTGSIYRVSYLSNP